MTRLISISFIAVFLSSCGATYLIKKESCKEAGEHLLCDKVYKVY